MTRKFTFIKFSILALTLCGILTTAKAAAPYPVYLTEGATVTLGLKTALKQDETVVWTKNGTGLTANANGSYTIAAGQTVGVHTYKVHVLSPSPELCQSEVTEYDVYVLPKTTVTLDEATVQLYCTNVDQAKSDFIATVEPADVLPDGVSYNYTWEGTFTPATGTAASLDNSWGSSLVSPDKRSTTFTFTNRGVGTYALRVKVEYVVPTGSVLITESDLLTKMTSVDRSIKVAPQPSQPEIVIVSN